MPKKGKKGGAKSGVKTSFSGKTVISGPGTGLLDQKPVIVKIPAPGEQLLKVLTTHKYVNDTPTVLFLCTHMLD